MMIKVSNEFLDFNEFIEIEKQIKLFEDISTTDGDFSYAFDLPKTLNNTKLLGNPFPDNISKPVYQRIPAKILGESGAELYDGYLRVERVTSVYSCSFFAGNNNWFGMIDGLLSELDLSAYDIEQTQTNIENSWLNDEGIVFPLLDNGGLLTRSSAHLKIEDFVGAFYIKTIFNRVFVEAGIKIKGELLEDWRYNNAVCVKNSKDQEEINARTVFVSKTTTQIYSSGLEEQVTWDQDSVFPYSNPNGYFNLTTESYTADVEEILKIELTLNVDSYSAFYVHYNYVRVNGAVVKTEGFQPPAGSTEAVCSKTFLVRVSAGDVVDIAVLSGFSFHITSGTLKITPFFIYKTFGKSAVPNWTKQQFVSNVLRMFNVLASYNEGDATLTLNIFEKIKSKPPIDLSEYISEVETDYTDFISDYGKNSKLSYNEVEFEELKSYNTSKYFKYSQGAIQVNNDFLEDNKEILSSDFSNPIAYINGVFDMSMEKTNLITFDESDEQQFTAVTDNAGTARFAIPNDIYVVGDLMRVTKSTNPIYNGEWVINVVGAGYAELQNVNFDTDATGTIIKLNYTYGNSDNVFIFINIPNYIVSKFSGNTSLRLEQGSGGTIALAYFDLIHTARQINKDFIYSLSFGGIDDPLHYQVTMIESYFRLFTRVLNDPVKLFCTAHLPYAVFVGIDFLSPITIKTFESTNSYYLNRISGYKESFRDCICEIIKLP